MLDENEIRQAVAEILERDAAEISDEASFVADLGMDSLRALEILAAVERKYKILIPPERLKDMSNMKGVIGVVKEYLGG